MSEQLLVDQNEALLDFLDDLLAEPEDAPEEVEPAEIETATADPSSGQPEDEEADFIADLEGGHLAGRPDLAVRVPIIPDWGESAFQVTVFKVGDLSLALPQAEVMGIVEWQADLADITEAAGIILGHYPHAGRIVTVIDTARFLAASEHHPSLARLEQRSSLSHIILINKGKTGLSCDGIEAALELLPDQVNWRSEKTRRKWLAGTVLDRLLVLLDSRSIVKMLSDDSDAE